MARSGLNKAIQKSLQRANWASLFSCLLVFHNRVLESRSVHSTNMFYSFLLPKDDFLPWLVAFLVLSWYLGSFYGQTLHYAVFLKHFITAAVILDLSCSFSVQASLSYSRVGAAGVLYVHHLVCFWLLESFRTWLIIPTVSNNFENLLGTFLYYSENPN